MGACGAVDLAAVVLGTSGLGGGLGTQLGVVGPPTVLHSLTPALLGERPGLLSFPHAQESLFPNRPVETKLEF